MNGRKGVNICTLAVESHRCPCGQMDKAFGYEPEDRGFDPHQGYIVFCCSHFAEIVQELRLLLMFMLLFVKRSQKEFAPCGDRTHASRETRTLIWHLNHSVKGAICCSFVQINQQHPHFCQSYQDSCWAVGATGQGEGEGEQVDGFAFQFSSSSHGATGSAHGC